MAGQSLTFLAALTRGQSLGVSPDRDHPPGSTERSPARGLPVRSRQVPQGPRENAYRNTIFAAMATRT